MMNSIFTSFDFFISYPPLYLLAPLLLFSALPTLSLLWYNNPRQYILSSILLLTHNLIMPTQSKLMRGAALILLSLFLLILLQNIIGLLPWAPSTTAHLLVSLSMALPAWFALPLLSYLLNPKTSSSHYLPESSTLFIAPFLAAIEGISSSIRPITLSFRLSANISAGHVIMGMMGTVMAFALICLIMKIISLLLMMGSGYMMFEVMIGSVQSFVLTLLLIMYSNDYLFKRPNT